MHYNNKRDIKLSNKKSVGRPKFEVNDVYRKQVETMSGLGMTQEHIAATIGCSVDTLVIYFKEELIVGKSKANFNISQTLYKKAIAGDTASLIWWSKAQMGWSESKKVELTGKDGGAIVIDDAKNKLLANIKIVEEVVDLIESDDDEDNI